MKNGSPTTTRKRSWIKKGEKAQAISGLMRKKVMCVCGGRESFTMSCYPIKQLIPNSTVQLQRLQQAIEEAVRINQ